MRLVLSCLLLATIALTSQAQFGVYCGDVGPEHNIGGRKIVIGTYATEAEAEAAAKNQAWVDSVFWRAVMESAGDVCEPCAFPGKCTRKPHLAPGTMYDLQWWWDDNLKKWVVTINLKDPTTYWLECTPCE